MSKWYDNKMPPASLNFIFVNKIQKYIFLCNSTIAVNISKC